MADDDPYNVLVRELTEISNRLDSDPVDAPVKALDVVSAFYGFLSDLGAPEEARWPVSHAINVLIDAVCAADHGNAPGPKPIPIQEIETLGVAAAAVTALRACGWSVDNAVKTVSKEAKIDHRRLKNLRDNIHRGRANPLIFDTYHDWVGAFPADEDGVLTEMRLWFRALC
jgi:hypothetical protein